MEKTIIKVEKVGNTKEDKTYFNYYINGTVRGIEVRVQVIPHDNGGYKVLDIVFNGGTEAELVISPFKFTSDDGNVIEGNTFKVVSADEDGTVYECPVQPARRSDKAMLDMLVRAIV